jgi:hypothetical protein
MADEDVSHDLEKVKRYLAWATLLVIVVICVSAIDLMTKQAILRAIKEADGKLKTFPDRSNHSDPVQSLQPMGDAPRATENRGTDANFRVNRTGPPKTSEEAGTSGDVLRTNEGSEDG